MATLAHKGNTTDVNNLTPQELRQSVNAQTMNVEALMKKCLNNAAMPEDGVRMKAEFVRQLVRLTSRLCDA